MCHFRVAVVDPPWQYNDRQVVRRDNPEKKPKFGIGVQRRYSAGCLSVADMAGWKGWLDALLTPDAYLFMWRTCPNERLAFDLLDAWGFVPHTVAFVWVKLNQDGSPFGGTGHYTMSNVETCVIARRKGQKLWHPNTGWRPNQVVFSKGHKSWPHSRKPPEVMGNIAKWLSPHLEGAGMLELFATQRTPGWTCLGHALSGTKLDFDLPRLLFYLENPQCIHYTV